MELVQLFVIARNPTDGHGSFYRHKQERFYEAIDNLSYQSLCATTFGYCFFSV